MLKLLLRYRKILPGLAVVIIFIIFGTNYTMMKPGSPRTSETANYVFYGVKNKIPINYKIGAHNGTKLSIYMSRIPREKCKKRLLQHTKINESKVSKVKNEIENKPKYILEWIPTNLINACDHQIGKNAIMKNNCDFTNCIITDDKKYFSDIRLFDAILFNRKYEDIFSNKTEMPRKRSVKQKYVFVSTIPAQTNVVLDSSFDNFFNWTWTYRHDSDIIWKYFTIHDSKSGKEIGPSLLMRWPNVSSVEINDTLKKVMVSKSKAAAWFAGNCMRKRMSYVDNITEELENYGWRVDVFGKCGHKKCRSNNECVELIKRNYYFYFAFEDAIDDDYVTDTVLVALNNFAIPVVYGGAEYSRFLPPNSYLNARALGIKKLAKTMNRLIRNMTEYYSYLEWINHYQFKRSEESKEICNICKALNDKTMMYEASYYKDFRIWWNRKRWTEMYDMILRLIGRNKFSEELVKRVINLIL